MSKLDDLAVISKHIGTNLDLVQGAGGNTVDDEKCDNVKKEALDKHVKVAFAQVVPRFNVVILIPLVVPVALVNVDCVEQDQVYSYPLVIIYESNSH